MRFRILCVDFEENIFKSHEYPLSDLLRIGSSPEQLAKARLGCGADFFHISGFAVKLTNPHSSERPRSSRNEDQI